MKEKTSKTKDRLYILRDNIIASMKKEGLKWVKPWLSSGMEPRNIDNGFYSGINWWSLNYEMSVKKYKHNYWATFLQWKKRSAIVKTGQKATYVFYMGTAKDKKASTEDKKKLYKFFKSYPVFNVSQVDLSNSDYKVPEIKKPSSEQYTIEAIETFIKATKINVKHDDLNRCFYNQTLDYVNMVPKNKFKDYDGASATVHYYSTLFHEFIHATGHSNRLDRVATYKNKFKDNAQQEYSYEELVAETGSALLSQHFNIEKTLRDNHSAYIKSWIKNLNDDIKFLTSALSKSYRAYSYLIKR